MEFPFCRADSIYFCFLPIFGTWSVRKGPRFNLFQFLLNLVFLMKYERKEKKFTAIAIARWNILFPCFQQLAKIKDSSKFKFHATRKTLFPIPKTKLIVFSSWAAAYVKRPNGTFYILVQSILLKLTFSQFHCFFRHGSSYI